MRQITDDDYGLNEYAEQALKSASYPNLGHNIIYPALGLVGEAGEVAEKIKKLWRNAGITDGQAIPHELKLAIKKELGDCLWYLAALAMELEFDLASVGRVNVEKLTDRLLRNVIKSEGDSR